MSRSEIRPDDSHLDPTRTLEQHLLANFPPDLALDLVLNELVVRAAEATRASAAALALARGDEMVCRAATGHLAPDLGIPINTRDGLSGACLQTRQPQLSVDTEFDPRVDPAISRRLGIRSILIVPVFDMNKTQFAGVLEVFSTSPAAFSHTDQKLLEGFAEECARVRHAAIELSQRQPAAALLPLDLVPSDFGAASPLPARRSPYEAWTLVLGSLVILATIAVSFLIGSRIGWLRPPQTASNRQTPQASPAETGQPPAPAKSCVGTAAPGCPAEASSTTTAADQRANPPSSEKASAKAFARPSPTPSPSADELVVYEKGKVIFRMKPASNKPDQTTPRQANPAPTKPASTKQDSGSIVEASSTTKLATTKVAAPKIAATKNIPPQSVWLAPAQAETRLLSRTEPQYPSEALAGHRAGSVVLEVQVTEDGTVSSIRTLSGDSLLAAAATEAVRHWRYQPYRLHDHPAQFQTDVTLTFSLPN
jgi:TonB family protein